MHKGEALRPSPEKPGVEEGGGWSLGSSGPGSGQRRSLGAADERGADGCSTAATSVFAEKFCSQVGGREIVTEFKAGKSMFKVKLQKEERAAVYMVVLPTRSVELPGEKSPSSENPGRPPAGWAALRPGGSSRAERGVYRWH